MTPASHIIVRREEETDALATVALAAQNFKRDRKAPVITPPNIINNWIKNMNDHLIYGVLLYLGGYFNLNFDNIVQNEYINRYSIIFVRCISTVECPLFKLTNSTISDAYACLFHATSAAISLLKANFIGNYAG